MSRVPKIRWHRTLFKLRGHCWFCGGLAETVDHAKPRSRQGTNKDDNLLPACFYCNNLKSDLKVGEFRRVVRILICRRLFSMGIIVRDWRSFPVMFYGEGNSRPWRY